MRNKDYYRYYKYCSRKIHRLRKATKNTQGRRKFVKNEIDADKVRENHRAIEIPLFCAERDWAQAMFFKKQLTEHGEEFSRNKYSARKKFKRAYQSAQQFYQLVTEVFDKQTCIEAEGYLESVKASYDIEYGRYQEALDALLKSRVIYKNLAKYKDSLEAAIYEEKVEQAEPLIRLCTYNLQNKTDQDFSNLEKLEEKTNESENLSDKISESMAGSRKENLENLTNINFQGKSIPLKTQKLKNIFQKLEAQVQEIEKLQSDSNATLKDKIDSHTSLLHIIEECVVIIQKEKTEETKKSEASGTLYNLLLKYVTRIKSNSILERCLLKAFAYAENIPLDQVFTKQKLKSAQRPQIVMKLFDKALKTLKSVAQERTAVDLSKVAEFNQKEMIIQVYLKFYIAVFYANEKNYSATYCVLKRANEEYHRCIEQEQKVVSSKLQC